MAWGFWNKVVKAIKKGWNAVKDHVVRPAARVVSKIAEPLGEIAETVLPGAAGKVVHKGIDYLSKFAAPPPPPRPLPPPEPTPNYMVGANGHGIRNPRIRVRDAMVAS